MIKAIKDSGCTKLDRPECGYITRCVLFLLRTQNQGIEEVAIMARDAGAVDVMKRVSDDSSNGVIIRTTALLVIIFMVGKEEKASTLTDIRPEQMKFLHDLLDNLLKNIGDNGKVNDLAYSFSPIIVVKSIRALCISDRNRSLIVKADFLPLMIKLLKRFVDNEKSLGTNAIAVGGGGADKETAATTVEAMLHLSFEYDDDAELQAKFMTPNLGIKELMNGVILREKFTVDETKNCKLLIGRLNPVVRAAVAPSVKVSQPVVTAAVTNSAAAVSSNNNNNNTTVSSAPTMNATNAVSVTNNNTTVAVAESSNTRRSHIMISYCWNAASKPEHIKEFGKQMRSMGYEIWRDEVIYHLQFITYIIILSESL